MKDKENVDVTAVMLFSVLQKATLIDKLFQDYCIIQVILNSQVLWGLVTMF